MNSGEGSQPNSVFEAPSEVAFDFMVTTASVWLTDEVIVALFEELGAFQRTTRSKGFDIMASRIEATRTMTVGLAVEPRRQREDGDYEVYLSLTYSRSFHRGRAPSRRARNLTRKATDLTAALSLLSPIIQEVQLECRGHWLLDTSQWEPVISLPLLRVNIPGTPFSRVSGVRLTSGDLQSQEFAILDMVGEGEFYVTMGFDMVGAISAAVFREVAEEAQRLLLGVVMPKGAREDVQDGENSEGRQQSPNRASP